MRVVISSASRTGCLYPQECTWYSFSLGAESTPGPWCGRKEIYHWKIQWHHRESIPELTDHYATPGPIFRRGNSYFLGSCRPGLTKPKARVPKMARGKVSLARGIHCCPMSFLSHQGLYIVKNVCMCRVRQWIGRFCNTVFFCFGKTGVDAAIAILLPTLKHFSCNGAVDWSTRCLCCESVLQKRWQFCGRSAWISKRVRGSSQSCCSVSPCHQDLGSKLRGYGFTLKKKETSNSARSQTNSCGDASKSTGWRSLENYRVPRAEWWTSEWCYVRKVGLLLNC
jgi:hypothetical protein